MSKLGIVLFGASKYDSHRELNNARFARSAEEFRKTTADPRIIPGERSGLLNLYDKPLSVNETLDGIMDFVGKDHDDIIIYYCGHGDAGLREGDYKVFLRTSNRERRYTLLDMAQLVHDVARLALKKRIYFVLDACYSGSAVDDGETMDVGGADAIINRRLSEAVADGGNGTAAFAASGRLGVALAKREDKLTLFTGAMARCLREGLVHRREVPKFSWLDLKDEIVRVTRDRLGPDAPIPQLRGFGDSPTDITRVPFFANVAFVAQADGTTPWLPAADDLLRELLYWRTISEQTPPEVLEDFLSKFPKGTYAAPARGLLLQRAEKFNAQQIKAYLGRHPDTTVKAILEAKRIALYRDRIRDCADLAELELIATEIGQGELADEVRERIQRLRAEQAAWDLARDSRDPEALRQFLELHPATRFGAQASARLAELEAARRDAPSAWSRLVATMRAGLESRAVRYAIAGLLLLVIGGGLLQWFSSGPSATDDSFSRDFVQAGDDAGLLRRFVAQCALAHCSLEQPARYKLAAVEISEQAQRSRAAMERSDLDAAGADPASLRHFLQQCELTSCSLMQEAKARLDKAEAAERDRQAGLRQAARDADRRALDVAGTDLAALRRFVQLCDASSCSVAQEARTRLTAAEAAETARQAQLAADRRMLDAAGSDLGALRRVVQQCDLASCSVAQEARRRLANAEAAANQRFTSYVNYDMHGGDFLDPAGKVKFIVTDAASCLSSCRGTAGCMAVSYDKWNGVCYLKRSLSELTLDPHSDTSVRADMVQPGVTAAARHFCPYSGSVLIGDDIQRVQLPSAGGCEQLCARDETCVAYSFVRTAGLCTALRAVSSRQSHVPDAASGVRTQYSCHG
jgi:PAN domain